MQQLKMNIQACEGAYLQYLDGSVLYDRTVFTFPCIRTDSAQIKYTGRRVLTEYYQSSQLYKNKNASCLYFTQSPLITYVYRLHCYIM